MFQKDKEKRKGKRRRWDWGLVLLLVASATMFGIDFYDQVIAPPGPPQPAAETFELVAFDVNESQDQIALSWRGSITNHSVARAWSDVQQEVAGSNRELSVSWGSYMTSLTHQANGSGVGGVTFSPQEGAVYPNSNHTCILSHASIVKYSPDGTWLVARTSDYGIRLSQTTPPYYGCNLYRADIAISTSHDSVFDIAISADNMLLAVVGTDTEEHMVIEVIRIVDQTVVYEISLPYDSQQAVLAFHPNSKQLAVAFDRTIHQIDLETGQDQIKALVVDEIRQVGYDPTGRWLAVRYASSGQTQEISGVDIYDLASETNSADGMLLNPFGTAVNFQFLSDHRIVIGTTNNRLHIWDWMGPIWVNTQTVSVAWKN